MSQAIVGQRWSSRRNADPRGSDHVPFNNPLRDLQWHGFFHSYRDYSTISCKRKASIPLPTSINYRCGFRTARCTPDRLSAVKGASSEDHFSVTFRFASLVTNFISAFEYVNLAPMRFGRESFPLITNSQIETLYEIPRNHVALPIGVFPTPDRNLMLRSRPGGEA